MHPVLLHGEVGPDATNDAGQGWNSAPGERVAVQAFGKEQEMSIVIRKFSGVVST